jgi:hypothetical protein
MNLLGLRCGPSHPVADEGIQSYWPEDADDSIGNRGDFLLSLISAA